MYGLMRSKASGRKSKSAYPSPAHRTRLIQDGRAFVPQIEHRYSLDRYLDDRAPNRQSRAPGQLSRKRNFEATMSASIDTDQTPRPTKKRHFAVEPPASLLQFSSSASSVAAASDTDDLESHHSGRVSPEKQMVYLEEEVEHPVFYRDFGCDDEIMDLDVEQLRRQVQALADGVGTLGWRVGTLEYTPGRLQADVAIPG